MSKDLNKVQIIGRLGADPEMKYTPQGSAVTTFSVASGRAWKDTNGQKREETEWFRCVAWDKLAEICNQYLSKGARMYVEGRLKTRKYTDRDGIERYITEVVMIDMIMLDGRSGAAGQGHDDEIFGDDDEPPPPAAPARPFTGAKPRTSAPPPLRNQPQPISSDLDEIPF